MAGFVASNVTKYDLLRERLLARYPYTINLILVLVLISLAGLALYLLSDLASFALDPEHETILESFGGNGGERDAAVDDGQAERGDLVGGNLSQAMGNLSRPANDSNLSNVTPSNQSISISGKEKSISSDPMMRQSSSLSRSSSKKSGGSSSSASSSKTESSPSDQSSEAQKNTDQNEIDEDAASSG